MIFDAVVTLAFLGIAFALWDLEKKVKRLNDSEKELKEVKNNG